MLRHLKARTRPKGSVDPGAVRGWGSLAFDATLELTNVVEAMHRNIALGPLVFFAPPGARTRGLTGFVYGCIRAALGLARVGFEAAFPSAVVPDVGSEALVAALNGVVGDHLAATKNPLAIPMQLRRNGKALVLERGSLARAIPDATSRCLVLLHGSCMSDRGWSSAGEDYGARLARDGGYTPLYLNYNSGLHVSVNGRAFSEILEVLAREWPTHLSELVLVGHSMGGLVIRSACHYGAAAEHHWPRLLTKIVFLGTPHSGAPLERVGNEAHAMLGVTPYTSPLSHLARLRGAGVTDLRHGSIVDEDWNGRDRFERSREQPRFVPLPEGVDCFAIAAAASPWSENPVGALVGDGLVPLDSALGRGTDPRPSLDVPTSRQWVGRGIGHVDLLGHPEVYEVLKRWLAAKMPPRLP